MSDLISRADAIERIANDNLIGGIEKIHEHRNTINNDHYIEGLSDAIATLEDMPCILRSRCEVDAKCDLISRADAIEAVERIGSLDTDADREYARSIIDALPSADAEDTQTEKRSRFVAKETELAHIEAKLENAEKRLQGACTANFVTEQLDRLRNMTDEERWNLFIKFFSPSADAVEVVRCKDCRHRDLFSCPLTDNDFQKDEDFCSWGERKGGEK